MGTRWKIDPTTYRTMRKRFYHLAPVILWKRENILFIILINQLIIIIITN